MISGSAIGNHSAFQTDRIPGEAPLPYIRGGRRSLIITVVVLFHAGLLLVPCFWMVVNEIKPPVYVMRMPIVESLPNDQPEMSPHPSPAAAKPVGTPERGKPLSEIPSIPKLVRPVDPPPQPQPKPQPKPQPQKKEKPVTKPDPIKQTPVKESKKVAPAAVKPQPKPQKKNTLLTPDQIKISRTKVKPTQTRPSAEQQRQAAEQQRQIAEQQARDARNAAAAQALRSLTGEVGGRGTPGGGGGPKGKLASSEISAYYSKVEAFLKRRWKQPKLFGSDCPKVLIRFRVTSSGSVSFVKIEQLSGVPAMDASVQELIADIRTLPAPPTPMEFTVTMEIDR